MVNMVAPPGLEELLPFLQLLGERRATPVHAPSHFVRHCLRTTLAKGRVQLGPQLDTTLFRFLGADQLRLEFHRVVHALTLHIKETGTNLATTPFAGGATYLVLSS